MAREKQEGEEKRKGEEENGGREIEDQEEALAKANLVQFSRERTQGLRLKDCTGKPWRNRVSWPGSGTRVGCGLPAVLQGAGMSLHLRIWG